MSIESTSWGERQVIQFIMGLVLCGVMFAGVVAGFAAANKNPWELEDLLLILFFHAPPLIFYRFFIKKTADGSFVKISRTVWTTAFAVVYAGSASEPTWPFHELLEPNKPIQPMQRIRASHATLAYESLFAGPSSLI